VNVVTTRGNKPKPFAWSYSRLKNYETCPKRHWHCDIVKDVKEEESDQLLYGNMLHSAMAKRISEGVPLPKGYDEYEDWAVKVLTGEGKVLVEQKLALNKDFGATSFFARDAWFRGVGDVIKIIGPVALVLDWKTGKIVEDSQQLALMAACVFAHHPEVMKVRSEFIWLKDDATTRADFTREGMSAVWASLWPRLQALEQAHNTTTYPAKPGGLCKRYCPVSQCPHHGGA
jgi:hypothetical protein